MAPLPPTADLDSGAAVRRVFEAAGYTADRIRERLNTDDSALASGPDRPVHLRRLGESDALAVLARMLLLDASVAPAVALQALGGDAVDVLLRCGLVAHDADGDLEGAARVVPHDHLLVASDLASATNPDHVAAVHGPSATLAHLTIRRPVARALDVGTGNGIQALLMSSHADHVVATDVNPRALAFAAFNVALNGVTNVEIREGSFFEPVAGEEFDLVVSNPPYVISPEAGFLFRDSGLPRDQVSEDVVRAAPGAIAEGGFATVMISWVDDGDGDPTRRPAGWLEGSGCDALVIHTMSDEPLGVAASWNRNLRGDPLAFAAAVERWVEYFSAHKIANVAFGAVVLRRRTGGLPNWIRATKLPGRRLMPSDAHLGRMFTAHDHLAAIGDERALLDERLVVVDDLIFEQRNALGPDGWTTKEASVALTGGMPFSAGLDTVTAALVLALDGTRTLRDAVPARDDAEAAARVGEICLRVARQMFELGFLRLAD